MSAGAGPAGPGLRDAAQQVLATLVDIGQTRLELLCVELEEERVRLARLWILAACTLFFAFVGVVLFAGWVVLMVDPAHRPAALGAMAALFLAAGIAGGWRWRHHSAAKPALLQATRAALRQDRSALRGGAEP